MSIECDSVEHEGRIPPIAEALACVPMQAWMCQRAQPRSTRFATTSDEAI